MLRTNSFAPLPSTLMRQMLHPTLRLVSKTT
jgi:hypothetical protein